MMRAASEPGKAKIRLGGVAILGGVLAAIVAVIALFVKKKKPPRQDRDKYDGWGESLGI